MVGIGGDPFPAHVCPGDPLLWGSHKAGLGALVNSDFPLVVCLFLIPFPTHVLASSWLPHSSPLLSTLHPFLASLNCLPLLCLPPYPVPIPQDASSPSSTARLLSR